MSEDKDPPGVHVFPIPPRNLRQIIKSNMDPILAHPTCAFFIASSFACLAGTWFSTGDKVILIPAIIIGWVLAALGFLWAPGLSLVSRSGWIAVAALLFGADGWFVYQHYLPPQKNVASIVPVPPKGHPPVNNVAPKHEQQVVHAPNVILSPVSQLAELGWTIKPGPKIDVFEVANGALPPMKESATYFRELKKPFNLHLQQVTGLQGLHYLADVAGCTKIDIDAGEFTDISELRGFHYLISLTIAQTPLSERGTVDISPLATLTNLKELSVGSIKPSTMGALGSLKRLTSLSIGGAMVSDLSPLARLNALQILYIGATQASDLSPLSKSQTLSELSIAAKQVPGLGSLSQIRSLKKLTIVDQVNTDLSPVGTLTSLEHLYIWGLPQFNILPLRRLTNLRDLSLTGLGFGRVAAVTDIEALGQLTELRTLTLGALEINDLTFVSSLKNLNQLNLGELQISSLASLRGLPFLAKISLTSIPVVDISPLLDLPSLTELRIMRTPARADVLTELEKRGVNVIRP